MTANQIKAIISTSNFEYYGIRSDDGVEYKVGDSCYASHQWWQDDPEDDALEYDEEMHCWDGGELPGTCALKVSEESDVQKILDFSSYCYGGKHITLIAGNYAEYGNDDGEIIIRDAIVLCA